jgi:transcriptional regulator with XRE-family HTH domain
MPGDAAVERLQLQTRRRLALNLKAARARLGLSQERAAEKAGYSLQYFQRIERCIVNTPIDTITRLSAALRLDPAELLSRPER